MATTSQQIQVLVNGNIVSLDVDSDLWGQGTLASRPASGDNVGDLYLVVDPGSNLLAFTRWNGSSWDNLQADPVNAVGGGAHGDILYRNATAWVVLPTGTAGQFLQTQGATANPQWTNRHALTAEWDKGADLASTASLILGTDGNYFDITGTTTITSLSAKPIGTRVLLQFDAITQLTHNATTLIMANAKSFTSRVGDHLELISYDGTNWREVSRSLNAGNAAGGVNFGNLASDPGGGVDGDIYYNTTIKMNMVYDGSRSKWLSVAETFVAFGRNGNTAPGAYYRATDGHSFSAVDGQYAAFNGTVVGLVYTRQDTDLATFVVTADGASIATVASTALAGSDSALNADFSQTNILGVRNLAGGNTTLRVFGTVRIRWRHT